MLVGSLSDIDDVETTESVLREISNQVHATRTAVLAQVTDQSPEVIDTAMARLGGEVMRRPVVDSRRRSPRRMRRSGRASARPARLRKARLEETKEDARAKVDELKSNLHRTKAGAAAAA